MSILTYHIASTIDGFISREDGSLPGFSMEGSHVDEYMQTLGTYDKVIMGRKTYEAGYAFGMKRGDNPYPHARTIVFSKSMEAKPEDAIEIINSDPIAWVKTFKAETEGEIYLCGGGQIAGQMLANKLIDKLVIKLSPTVYGKGTPMFGGHDHIESFKLVEAKPYDTGTTLLTYLKA